MSEKIKTNAEYSPDQQKTERFDISSRKNESVNVTHEHQDRIGEIRGTIEKSGHTSEEISKDHHREKPPEANLRPVQIGSQLHSQALRQNLKKVQSNLPVYQRQFSKFIHNPKVEKLSDATGTTIARPSGLLFAGIFSFIASLAVLTICRYFGYEYNYLIGLASLGGGFLAGLFLEAFLKIVKKFSAR
ncbi:hypothetical protein KY385_03115 [Candidatus Parcubacteria bacterium]|nr:hypothetical protein [Candidatus Parcubacteria bacterium]